MSMRSFRGLPPNFWVEMRAVIGESTPLVDEEEWRNEISPNLCFRRIYDFDDGCPDQIRRTLLDVFGQNGTPPPTPHMDDVVGEYAVTVAIWLFRHGFGAEEAAKALRDHRKPHTA